MSKPTDKDSNDQSTDSTQRITDDMRRGAARPASSRPAATPPPASGPKATEPNTTKPAPASAQTARPAASTSQPARPATAEPKPAQTAAPKDRPAGSAATTAREDVTVRRAAVAQTPQASESTAAAAAVGKRRVVRKRRRRAHVVDPAITREGSLLGPLLLGLLLLAAIAWFAIKHYTPHIQRDLLRRSTEALQNEGLPNSAFVEIDGRNATLKGSVANRADRDRAEAAVAGTFGVRHVDNQLSLAGTGQQQATSRQPSTFSVARDGEKTTIQGTVSAQHYADSLTDAAEQAFGADNIDSNIAIEAGTTNPGWLPALPGLLSDVAQLPDGSLDITGDAITLSGTTETNEQRDALLAKADAAVGNLLTVNDELTSLQPESATAPVSEASDSETTEDTTAQDTETAAQPAAEETPPVETPAPQMSLGLSNRGDSIELRGAMGDEQTKAALLEQAQLIYGEDAVTDAITIDPAITDPQWAQSIGSSFADIKSLKHGNLSIGNGAAFLTGTTNSPSTKTAIEEKLAATFAGDTDFESNVMAIPDRPASLLIKNTDSEIALSGNLPPQSAADLLTAVEGGTDLPLIDLINIDDRVITPDWVDPLTQSLSQLDSIEQPSVEIDAEGTLIVGGQADTAEARETAAASVAELFPESVSLRNDINVKTPTIVEPEPVDINTLLAGIDLSGIRFGSNSAELTPESLAILDSVADALSQVPGTSLEIGGHTDSLGDYNYNLSLSASRAEAVRSQLASRGIADERMIARGYGPDSPIATNETRAGRASNRRIEFKIITGD